MKKKKTKEKKNIPNPKQIPFYESMGIREIVFNIESFYSDVVFFKNFSSHGIFIFLRFLKLSDSVCLVKTVMTKKYTNKKNQLWNSKSQFFFPEANWQPPIVKWLFWNEENVGKKLVNLLFFIDRSNFGWLWQFTKFRNIWLVIKSRGIIFLDTASLIPVKCSKKL